MWIIPRSRTRFTAPVPHALHTRMRAAGVARRHVRAHHVQGALLRVVPELRGQAVHPVRARQGAGDARTHAWAGAGAWTGAWGGARTPHACMHTCVTTCSPALLPRARTQNASQRPSIADLIAHSWVAPWYKARMQQQAAATHKAAAAASGGDDDLRVELSAPSTLGGQLPAQAPSPAAAVRCVGGVGAGGGAGRCGAHAGGAGRGSCAAGCGGTPCGGGRVATGRGRATGWAAGRCTGCGCPAHPWHPATPHSPTAMLPRCSPLALPSHASARAAPWASVGSSAQTVAICSNDDCTSSTHANTALRARPLRAKAEAAKSVGFSSSRDSKMSSSTVDKVSGL